MESEKLAVLNEFGDRLGVASRSEVHEMGYWHETFHCWLAHRVENSQEIYIYFQLRSDDKKDFPSLLDITAAGHILYDEKIEDGVREVHEELGITVTFEELQPLGIVKGELVQEAMIDREFTHVFLYSEQVAYDEFELDPDEVSGIFRSTLADFKALVTHEKKEMDIEGFIVHSSGDRECIQKKAEYRHFVPHERSYLLDIIERISTHV
ncbi:NUDIX domain-containing protein [Rossellomorea aquimaris]|uniref:NUDIX hydrolase n=1 Tax=Rossellomorea aquimaris TaxID=189382 RepID=UPI001CD3BDAD|nr:NUDIX domain-containing protein [Rossellomorea aquimaris]MCA1058993.1 NUDIX domain-containing protein [Rossellomorea aquimaris]